MTVPNPHFLQESPGSESPQTIVSSLKVSREISLAEAMTILETVKMEDLRRVEILEFHDVMGRFPVKEEDFPVLLMSLLGLTKLRCKVFAHFNDNDLVFMASSSPLSSGSKLLCGIGMAKWEPRYDRRARMEIISDLLKVIVMEDDCQEFKCYVKNSNTDTLKMWEIVKTTYRKSLSVSFTPVDKPVSGYTLVTITKKEKHPCV